MLSDNANDGDCHCRQRYRITFANVNDPLWMHYRDSGWAFSSLPFEAKAPLPSK